MGRRAHSSVPPVPGLPGEGDHLVPTLRYVAWDCESGAIDAAGC